MVHTALVVLHWLAHMAEVLSGFMALRVLLQDGEIMMTHFNHREEGEFGDGCTMIRIPKRRGWEITGYAILAWAVIASIFALVIASAP